MRRAVFVILVACLVPTLATGVALAGGKQPAPKFPKGAQIKVTNVPPFFWTFSWPAATGTFDNYRLDLNKTTAPYGPGSINVGTATRYTVETVSGEGYLYCSPGDYKVAVSVMAKGAVCDTIAVKGTVRLK